MTLGTSGQDATAGKPLTGTESWVAWLAGRGGMAARVAGFAWEDTPLGPIEGWPDGLRYAVTICVESTFPMTVWWGPELTLIPNDAARATFGAERFDTALGRPVAEVWAQSVPRIRSELGQLFESSARVLAVDALSHFDRTVAMEECYLTYSYTPLHDGDVLAGVLCVFLETTREVVAVRRLGTLAELGLELNSSSSEVESAELAMQVLARNPADHPAVALYRRPPSGEGDLELLASFGEPARLGLDPALAISALTARQTQHAEAREAPVAAWHAYPLLDPDGAQVSHVLVFGHHRSLPWNPALEGYLRLVAGTIGGAIVSRGELWAERRNAARLAALDTARSEFFAGVSHELRTPLALISAPLQEVLDSEPALSAESTASLALAQSSVARLTRMVEAMLDFSRMEAGQVVPELASHDISVLTSGLAASFAPAFQRAGLEFTADAPELSRPAVVDQDLFERIVLNLLSNALKFTPTGQVRLRLAEDGDSYLVEVTDTGLGIEPADQERVFARFERLAPRPGARDSSGAGIGLAMVRHLTSLLDGTVRLESSPGVGSSFTVRLPFRPSRPVGVAGRSITPRRVESFLAEFEEWADAGDEVRHDDGPGARLLVVEDDAQLGRFLAHALRNDYRVTLVGDGLSALSAMRDRRPDIVLSDVAMPGLDGIGLLREVRSDPALRDLPVVMLSARDGDSASGQGLESGADDYVTKPFSLADLRSRLSANLARARQRSTEAAWRRAVLASMHEGVLVFDGDGLVLEMNQAFTELFGYTMADGPFRPPYPWWPTAAEDADQLSGIQARHDAARAGVDGVAEFRYRDRNRAPIWVASADASICSAETGVTATIRTFRDVSRLKEAQERRAAAARVSADFAKVDDLATVLGVAEHGFELLFDGASTIRIDLEQEYLFRGGHSIASGEVDDPARVGLLGSPSPDATSLRSGILLVPQTSTIGCRAWVQFPRPRRITPDEMIAADLLAQAFGLAVDRVTTAQEAADRQANLQLALESHRLIGQAVGILVERHRLLPSQAFERLRRASQDRNLKLRDVAARVIETGAEPDTA